MRVGKYDPAKHLPVLAVAARRRVVYCRPRYTRAVVAFIRLAMIRIMLKRLVANPF